LPTSFRRPARWSVPRPRRPPKGVRHIILDVVLQCRRRFTSLPPHALLATAMPSLLWPIRILLLQLPSPAIPWTLFLHPLDRRLSVVSPRQQGSVTLACVNHVVHPRQAFDGSGNSRQPPLVAPGLPPPPFPSVSAPISILSTFAPSAYLRLGAGLRTPASTASTVSHWHCFSRGVVQ
jgi:hypothetical protein